MLPTKLTALDPESERARYAVVRLDTLEQMPGMIVAASVETGIFFLKPTVGDTQEFNLGPNAIRIVVRR